MEANQRKRTSQFGYSSSFMALLLLHLGTLFACSDTREAPAINRPNILILVADDLGYTDLGCFGGIINTPNLDTLARKGIRFTNFYTAPMCAPTRAMLLTGTDNHIAGMGRQNLSTDLFGYEGELSNRVHPMPALLMQAGYHTSMAGKWHLGNSSASNPHNKGFENSFVLLEGVGNHYNGQGIFKGMPSNYTENGKRVSWPEGRYSTDLYTDKLIDYIGDSQQDSLPFFAYAAYTSPHWPLQVDPTYRQKYRGSFDEGYEIYRKERMEALRRLRLIDGHAGLPETYPGVVPWDSLPTSRKAEEVRKMELYAGMVENLDDNIGRLIKFLKEIGEYENTIIVFMSDNGAAGEDYYNEQSIRPHIQSVYDNSIENMGKPTSLVSYGPAWAEAGSAPFSLFKEYTTEGGIRSPMIISWPDSNRYNEVYDGLVTVMDIAPTLYEAAGVHYPPSGTDTKTYPLEGTSMLPYLRGIGTEIHNSGYGFGIEHFGYTMYRKGDWKIVNLIRPFSEENFRLYRISTDPGEQDDLRESEPGKYRELLELWKRFVEEKRVQLSH